MLRSSTRCAPIIILIHIFIEINMLLHPFGLTSYSVSVGWMLLQTTTKEVDTQLPYSRFTPQTAFLLVKPEASHLAHYYTCAHQNYAICTSIHPVARWWPDGEQCAGLAAANQPATRNFHLGKRMALVKCIGLANTFPHPLPLRKFTQSLCQAIRNETRWHPDRK